MLKSLFFLLITKFSQYGLEKSKWQTFGLSLSFLGLFPAALQIEVPAFWDPFRLFISFYSETSSSGS